MKKKYITTVQDLIDVLNQVEDKSRHLSIHGITVMDSNCRNKYEYFYNAEIWGLDSDKGVTLSLS